MKMNNLSRIAILIVLLTVVISCGNMGLVQNTEVSAQDLPSSTEYTLQSLAGTDALGRTLPAVSGYESDRYVGLFYFVWLGQQGEKQDKVYDNTKLLKTNYKELFSTAENDVAPFKTNYFFNEPLFGYYNSADPYIIRKHLEMFIAADVDFLVLDMTNGIFYGQVMSKMLDIYLEYQNAGWKVPKLMFMTKTSAGSIVQQLYQNVYRNRKYDSLWFRAGGEKPLIIAPSAELNDTLKNYFTVRETQWPEDAFNAQGWPYVEKVRPQRLFTNVMSVSVAQHTGDAFSFSVQGPKGKLRESWGRGYTTENPKNGNVLAILRGDNFQEQWDYAIEQDPEIIFVTGWNEWTALKSSASWAGSTAFWVDTFNTEFSRDIEMTKAATYVKGEDGTYIQEGYGDNYYMQLIANIRKYKGLPATSETFSEPVSKTIDIYGDISQWTDVTNTYRNISTQKIERAHYGYIESDAYYYTQAAPDNFVTDVQVTHDSNNLYVKITCDSDITEKEQDATNWMNLLLGVEDLDAPAWENYNYVINRTPASDTQTSLECVTKDGTYAFEKVTDVSYMLSGNVLQLSIPKDVLGISEDKFTLYFKVTDSIEHPEDIMDYYVSGLSMPLGRLSYTYALEVSDNTVSDSDGNGGQDSGSGDNNGERSEQKGGLSATEWVLIGVCVIVVSCVVVVLIKFKRK